MSGKKVTRRDLRRFLKKELVQLAKDNDFGFKPKSKMTKIELINLIFTSPQFKVMKDNIKMKPKRKISQKVLDNLQKGREMRKKQKEVDSNKEYYSPEPVKENKKEEKIVKPKEELVDEEKASMIPTIVEDKPQFIETQEIKASTNKLQVENELIPYESVVVDNERIETRENQAVLQKGANAVSGLSGEQVSVVTTEKVDKQQRNLELPTLSALQQIKDEILNIQDRIIGEQSEGDAKTLTFLEKLQNLFVKVKDEDVNKKQFEQEQKEQDINKVNPDLLVTLKDINAKIYEFSGAKSETMDRLAGMLNEYKKDQLLEMSTRRSGNKTEIIQNIINQSLKNDEVLQRTIKLSDNSNVEGALRGLRNLEGSLAYYSAQKRSKEIEIQEQQLNQKQQSIKDIESKSGHNSYTMESQAALNKEKKKKNINNNRNATEEQKKQFDLRL